MAYLASRASDSRTPLRTAILIMAALDLFRKFWAANLSLAQTTLVSLGFEGLNDA
ncbi:hypothetical protein [Croceicoccus naphthovorans]|uniref:hypothetical protein n=2 Tax=Erythrobacteraceae TaxID=335929 RepID=UPI001C54DFBA|nr:hypothetical protein [Croceicoccus naphthovorans]